MGLESTIFIVKRLWIHYLFHWDPLFVSRINYDIAINFANSIWIRYFSRIYYLIRDFICINNLFRERTWINYFYREFTMNLLFFANSLSISQIHCISTICFGNSLSISRIHCISTIFFADSLWINFLFRLHYLIHYKYASCFSNSLYTH